MNILEFLYNEKTISFDPVGDDNVLVNATEMAKAFGKRIDNFLRLDNVNEFIEALIESLNEDREFPHIRGNSQPIIRDDIIQTKGQNGTWMHRILALEFAGWLDAKFKVWVWRTIDKIMLGHFREVQSATYEKLAAEKARDNKREQLLRDNPDFVEFLSLEGKISESEKKRQKAIRASMYQFKIEFQNK